MVDLRARWSAPAAGLVNGLLIAYGRMVPFIATLAMMAAARGLAQRMSRPQDPAGAAGQRRDRGAVHDPACSACRCWSTSSPLVVVVGWIVLNRTTFGRRTYAVGGNPEAARLAGIDVQAAHHAAVRAVRPVLRHRRGR